MPSKLETSPLYEIAEFNKTIQAHRPRLEAILRHRVRETPLQESVDDIFQNAHMLAYQKWPAYRQKQPPLDPFVWLYGVVRDCWIGEFRKSQRNGRHLQNVTLSAETSFQIGANLSAGTGTPSYKVMRDEMIDIVRRAIAMLPERDRVVIEMHDDDGLTFREIAAQFGETPEAVNKRYTRARNKKLKALLETMLGDYRP